ncbi:Putative uncharacterized protein [Moritella viscosa]|uniref:Uncharacterized protein n=1 Tax=Moritella viscosa TaxID=80854 RepID=A0A090IGT9_9GAMM|nr:hypothetical protein [Moritella viscosa]CED59109.1 putative exported protein [Moritella viscosa]SGZ07416.1 Putative uncharacterized protein [Moritella viscosa]SGZ16739.1 Putative uncharacterized protein [Moritella viscosa]SHN99320.1 Putative uncharacterized protein [Moritella viscosa]SHN99321.1 Putative uncharacterized protein [Moritella viscosa]
MKHKKIFKNILSTMILSTMAVMIAPVKATPINTNVVAVVDESGSMSTEHGWLGMMITSLDAALLAAAAGDSFSATYGLTGYGASGSGGHAVAGHQHTVGGGQLGSAAQFDTATGGLVLTGAHEDGLQAIDYALTSYTYTGGAVKNIILVTDEDSDGSFGVVNAATSLSSAAALLNAIINVSFECGNGNTALGMTTSLGYEADGSGGFSTCTGATATTGTGTSIADYVNLALDTGGAAWDLNQLRAGGLTATSFTNAFVDIKVEEIINVPAPTTVAFLGLGVLSMGMLRRQIKSNMENLV